MMKALDQIFEGLLDADFDVSVEPIKPNFKRQSTYNQFASILIGPNSIVSSYPVFNKLLETIKEVNETAAKVEFPTPELENLSEELERIHSHASGHAPRLIERSYRMALDDISKLKSVVAVAEEADNLLYKMKAPDGVQVVPLPNDMSICVFPNEASSEWLGEHLDELKTKVNKIKGVRDVEVPDTKLPGIRIIIK